MKTPLLISQLDYQRLQRLINGMAHRLNPDLANIKILAEEIGRAKKVEPRKMKPGYVTMNSEFELLDLDSKRPMRFRLVYPEEADFRQGKLSVLSPLGSALIGYREGDEISFSIPAGKKNVRIKNILFQPEENGEYAL